MIESLKDDVRELYGDHTGYVGSWEVKCPVCGNYTPLSFTWSLLELRRSGNEDEEDGEEKVRVGAYKRIVYMKPVVENNKLRIKVIDLNKEMESRNIFAKVSKNRIVIKDSGKSYEIPQGNVKVENNYARCLYCGSIIPGKGEKWYVREAIREWNENYERFLNGEISLEELRNSKARPTLLVKFKGEGKNLYFQEITDEDKEVFWEAFNKLREINIMKIPTEKAFPYGLLAFY
ncbi:hypothetical protein [Sulfurisphaera ohwakuensis]|uniref:Adenine-specific DNA methylase n=1 Tax=Sulfurisphaera ohwakuensis TaxID=69656 RepID=A0A7J9RY16_SULOH|nr:hypothetical protein [Sulfurisphaera ohwakuensis]MBB5254124.1 adenine-specific DNA methylase [Sulfurisphaera ohwakuensis]